MNIRHLISEDTMTARVQKAFSFHGKTYETIFRYNESLQSLDPA